MIDMRKILDKILDLRKNVMAAIRVKPSDSKEDNFNLALAEYLYKELKTEGLPVSRQNVIVNVALDKPHLDKYNNLIIDCHAGRMYLRGKEIKDKYFGRLRRFEGGTRPGDAYHCVSQSATRIINRIKRLLTNTNTNEIEVLGKSVDRIDMRRKNVDGGLNKTASRFQGKNSVFIEMRDHRKIFAWLQDGRVVASAYDDRIKKNIHRIDMRKTGK